jgi:hypothetical protein
MQYFPLSEQKHESSAIVRTWAQSAASKSIVRRIDDALRLRL